MTETRRPFVVGLTGGIASGKTAASDRFAALGVPVIDADVIARDVVEPGSDGLAAVVNLVGEHILDQNGALDRAKLRREIFRRPPLRKDVEAILHPVIRRRMDEQIALVDYDYCLLAIPLLVESGRSDQMDRVLVVDVPVEVQRERLMARDGSTPDQVDQILAAQATREARHNVADDIIDNAGTLEDLDRQVAELHRRYLRMARRSRSSTTG